MRELWRLVDGLFYSTTRNRTGVFGFRFRKLSKVLIAVSSFRRSCEFFSSFSRRRWIAPYASRIRSSCRAGLRSRIAARYCDNHTSFNGSPPPRKSPRC
jgi:hypothetical protein